MWMASLGTVGAARRDWRIGRDVEARL